MKLMEKLINDAPLWVNEITVTVLDGHLQDGEFIHKGELGDVSLLTARKSLYEDASHEYEEYSVGWKIRLSRSASQEMAELLSWVGGPFIVRIDGGDIMKVYAEHQNPAGYFSGADNGFEYAVAVLRRVDGRWKSVKAKLVVE